MRKLNIHLTVSPNVVSYCKDINRSVRKLTESVIDFEADPPMFPHISLIMGILDEKYNLDTLITEVKTKCTQFRPFTFRVLNPYLENVRNHYVFSDIVGNGDFTVLKQTLHSAFNGTYLHTESDYSEVPHITLAHINEKYEEVRQYLKGIVAGMECVCDCIEISDAGPKGTCSDSLFRLPLR